jgi:hypothetical protein
MFGLGPATKIYMGVDAVDMRKYAPSIVMWSRQPGGRRSSPLWWLWTAHNVVYCLERSIASSLSGGRNWPRRTMGGTNDAIVSNFSAGSARK